MCNVQVARGTRSSYWTQCEREGKFAVKVKIVTWGGGGDIIFVEVCGQHKKMLESKKMLHVQHLGQEYTVQGTEESAESIAKKNLDRAEHEAKSAHHYQKWHVERVGYAAQESLDDLLSVVENDERFLHLSMELRNLRESMESYQAQREEVKKALAEYEAVKG